MMLFKHLIATVLQKLNAFQNALLEELVGRCEVKTFSQIIICKGKKNTKSEKLGRKVRRLRRQKKMRRRSMFNVLLGKKQSNVTVVEKQDEGGKEKEKLQKKKSSTLTKDTEDIQKEGRKSKI